MNGFVYESRIGEALALMHLGEVLSGMADCGDTVVAETQGHVTTASGGSIDGEERVIATYDRRDQSFRLTGPEGYVRGMSLDWPDRPGARISELPEDLLSTESHEPDPPESVMRVPCRQTACP